MKAITDLLTIINNLKVPVGNLGLSRQIMPQIDKDRKSRFFAALDEYGIMSTEETVSVMELRLIQAEVNKTKVWKFMGLLRQRKVFEPILISADDFVLDGSHRFVATMNKNRRAKMKVIRLHMNALELVRLLKVNKGDFGTRYRSLSGDDIE